MKRSKQVKRYWAAAGKPASLKVWLRRTYRDVAEVAEWFRNKGCAQ